MIEFVLGRKKSGKSRYLISKMSSYAAVGQACYFLVPEQSTLENEGQIIKEIEIIKESGSKGLLDIQVISFRKLGNLLLKKTSIRTKKILKENGQMMILSKVVSDLDKTGQLKIFSRPKENVLNEILQVVDDLADYDITNHGYEVLNKNQSLLNKVNELIHIKENYQKFIENVYVDESSYYKQLRDSIETSSAFLNAHVFVDDFYKFSARQLEVLKALMVNSKSFTISFNMDESGIDAFKPTIELYNDLYDFCLKKNLSLKPRVVLNQQYYINDGIKFLENNLILGKKNRYSGEVKDIIIKKATNIDLEVKVLFEDIIKLIDSGTYTYRDIKVVCNNMDEYRNYLKLYRKIYDIPLFIDEKVNLHNHPIVRLILGFLILKDENHTETIFDILKTGFFDFTYEEIEKLEKYSKENGICYGKWNRSIKDRLELEAARKKLITILEDIRCILTGDDFKTKTSSLYEILVHFGIYEKLEARIDGFKNEGNFNNIYINTQIWNVVLDTFDQLVSFLGREKISFREFHTMLKGSLGRENISILPVNSNEVLVVNSRDAFKEKAKAVFIIGANEGYYPEKISQEILFPLEESSILEDVFAWKKNDIYKQQIKKLELYYSLTMATNYLSIGYSQSDSKGEGQKPAHVVNYLKRIFSDLKEIEVTQEDNNYYYSKETTLINFIKDIYLNKVNIDKSRYAIIKDNYTQLLDNLFNFNKEQNDDGRIAEEIVARTLFKNGLPYFSISKLESFGACPYKFFIKNVLKPEDEKNYEISSLDLGTLYHNLLDKVGRQGWLEKLMPSERSKKIEELVKNEYEKQGLDRLDSNVFTYQLEKIMEEGGIIVDYLIEEINNDKFKPRFYELAFGGTGEASPYILELEDDRKIYLEGKIDRIDIFEYEAKKYIRVMDYKLSGKKLNYRLVRDGISFQLFLYLKALLADTNGVLGDKLEPSGLIYTKLIKEPGILDINTGKDDNSKLMSGIVIEEKDLDKSMPKDYIKLSKLDKVDFMNLSNQIDYMIKKHAARIMAGDFIAKPYYYKSDNMACTYCKYLNICRNKTRYNVLKKSTDKDVLNELRKKSW